VFGISTGYITTAKIRQTDRERDFPGFVTDEEENSKPD